MFLANERKNIMTLTPQTNKTHPLQTLASPYQLKLAQDLSKDMAVVQANQLLTADILNKIGELAKLEDQILNQTPDAKPFCDAVLQSFAYKAVQRLR